MGSADTANPIESNTAYSSSSYDSKMLTEDALKKLSTSTAAVSQSHKSNDSKQSDGLMLRPMNSEHYTAAQNGVQSVVSRMTEERLMLSKSQTTTIEENKELKVETFEPTASSPPPNQESWPEQVRESARQQPVLHDIPADVIQPIQQQLQQPPQQPQQQPFRAASPPKVRPPIETQLPTAMSHSPHMDAGSRSRSPMKDLFDNHPKQIKDQRRPMYTPAVLRTNEMSLYLPDRAQSENSLIDDEIPTGGLLRKLYRPKLSHSRSSLWSTPAKLNPEDFLPTRKHWKADSSTFSCKNCGKLFHFLTLKSRKHHCRHCGDIFCGDCLCNVVYLNADAKFVDFVGEETEDNHAGLRSKDKPTPASTPPDNKPKFQKLLKRASTTSTKSDVDVGGGRYLSKVCDLCYSKYETFLNDIQHAMVPPPTEPSPHSQQQAQYKKVNDASVNSVGSIPVDWNWSSF